MGSSRMKKIKKIESKDPFVRAVEFDTAATEMEEWEEARCRKDGSGLDLVRAVGVDMWDGTQNQYQCPACGGKYVQFIPEAQDEPHH